MGSYSLVMPSVPAKLVTIITVFEARDHVQSGLRELGLGGYSVARVEGHGVHGELVSGFGSAQNFLFLVLTSAERAAGLLEWVERALVPNFPGIAYAVDAVAVPASALQAPRTTSDVA
jgi:hypothetical protein